MRFHMLGLYHTEMSDYDIACAYTQKIVKFTKMMTQLGHEVITYGGAIPCAHATEHVFVRDVPEHDPNRLYDCDWENGFVEYNKAVIPLLAERMSGHDFLCITAGTAHQSVMDAFPNIISVETGIGYYGTCAKFRVFESYAWMHTVYERQHNDNGRFYDAVIPNYFDPLDFPDTPSAKPGDHLVWMGRFIERKGPHVAYQVAQAAGRFLMMAGQGVIDTQYPENGAKIVGAELTMEGLGFEHIGPVGKLARGTFLSNAHALLMPTLYVEPFGGVAVEAMMCGTPVISTDWGAFPEFVIPGLTGYRFHTLKEAVRAVEDVSTLDRGTIQHYARSRFSLEAVGPQYERYFERLLDLWKAGWNQLD